jgi:hypothetical protein
MQDPDRTIPVGGIATLDGSASTDVDGDPLDVFMVVYLSPGRQHGHAFRRIGQ